MLKLGIGLFIQQRNISCFTITVKFEENTKITFLNCNLYNLILNIFNSRSQLFKCQVVKKKKKKQHSSIERKTVPRYIHISWLF